MKTVDLSVVQQELSSKGWFLPDERTKLGAGGGGDVFLCYRQEAVDVFRNFVVGAPSDPKIGGRIASVLSLLGQGDFARNFLGALKVAKTDSPRTKVEIDAMAKISHRHLVRLHAHDESERPRWFVMDYFRRGILHENLQEFRGDATKVVRAVLPVARALGAVHRAGVVHRDVKTKNIFIGDTGDLILGDLGIAIDVDGERHTTYESPMSRDWIPRWPPGDLDSPARDVYSLARVMYTMLTGHKQLEPGWLNRDDYRLTSLFPNEPGMSLIHDLLYDHIVDDRTGYRSEDGDAFADAIASVLRDVEALDSPGRSSLLFSWVGGSSSGPNFSLIPIKPGFASKKLIVRVRTALERDEVTVAVHLEDRSMLARSRPFVVGQRWSDAEFIDLGRNVEPGWLRVTVDAQRGAITGVVIHSE